jgi:hypothetical protein
MNARALIATCSFLPLLFAAMPFMPAGGQAQASVAHTTSITGTLVARPAPAAPTVLFLQVGGQTIPVAISATTRLTGNQGYPIALTALQNGDRLTVYGTPNREDGISATLIIDTTLPPLSSPTPTASATANVPPTITVSPTATSSPSPVPPVKMTVRGVLASLPMQVTAPATLPMQVTAPATLCLIRAQVESRALAPNTSTVSPCPSGQLPVYVISTTRLLRNENGASALAELRVGDDIQVYGSFQNTQFTAIWLIDHSLQEAYSEVSGVVQSVTPAEAVTNVLVAVSRVASQSGVPNNVLLVLPLANATSSNCAAPSAGQFPCTAVTVNGATSRGYSGNEIVPGNTVSAEGLYNSNLNQMEFVRWIRVASPAPTITPSPTIVPSQTPVPTVTVTPAPGSITVTGSVAAPAKPDEAPALLCVLRARVTQAVTPNVAVVSPCPAGQLPVYLISTTRVLRNNGSRMPISWLRAGNSVLITGSFINTQFTATVVKDRSVHDTYQTWLVAKVQYVSPFTRPTYFAARTVKVSWHWTPFANGTPLTIYMQARTAIVLRGHTYHNVKVLNPGQQVKIWGTYDRDDRSFSQTTRVQNW